MLDRRTVRVVFVTPQHPTAFDSDAKGDRSVGYDGRAVAVHLD